MRILIVGLGSIGRRHVKNLKTVDPQFEIAVLRTQHKDSDLGDITPLVASVFFDQAKALDWKPELVVIANPAPMHVPMALVFAQAGAHVFIEKPLSLSTEGIDALKAICEQKQLKVMVGYVLRFSAPVLALKQAIDQGTIGRILNVHARVGRYLPEWRPGGDYRQNVSARRELGGGVLWELSHELDYVRWLVGEVDSVQSMIGHLSPLEMDVEDLAEMTLRHQSQAISHIHLDMFDRAANRGCRIIGTEGTLIWDSAGSHHEVRLFSQGQWKVLYETQDFDPNSMHLAQWRHFLECIQHNRHPLIDLNEGGRIVNIIQHVFESAAQQKAVGV